jgi:hypothetical protein
MNEEVSLIECRDDELVSAFVLLRDKRDVRKKEFEAKDSLYADRLDKIQGELLRRQNERGIDQIKVAGVGTAFKTTKMIAQCADWDVFFNWCVNEVISASEAGRDPKEVFAFFQKRLTVDTVKQFMEAHEGGVPPAVNAVIQYAVSVRRSTK